MPVELTKETAEAYLAGWYDRESEIKKESNVVLDRGSLIFKRDGVYKWLPTSSDPLKPVEPNVVKKFLFSKDQVVANEPKRGPGRPKGSKNKKTQPRGK